MRRGERVDRMRGQRRALARAGELGQLRECLQQQREGVVGGELAARVALGKGGAGATGLLQSRRKLAGGSVGAGSSTSMRFGASASGQDSDDGASSDASSLDGADRARRRGVYPGAARLNPLTVAFRPDAPDPARVVSTRPFLPGGRTGAGAPPARAAFRGGGAVDPGATRRLQER